jgi:hypothetical protein
MRSFRVPKGNLGAFAPRASVLRCYFSGLPRRGENMEIAAPVAIAQNCLAGCGQGQSGGEIPRQTRSEQIKLLSAKTFALRVEFST